MEGLPSSCACGPPLVLCDELKPSWALRLAPWNCPTSPGTLLRRSNSKAHICPHPVLRRITIETRDPAAIRRIARPFETKLKCYVTLKEDRLANIRDW